MKTTSFLLATVFLAASLCACGGKTEANRKTGAQAQGKVLATVNDVPITEYDMKLISRRVGHGEQANPEPSPAMLDTLVRNELIRQQSLELGLDKNQDYRTKLSEVEAQVREFERQEMAVLYREYVRSKAVVTDAEAQDYFNKNAKTIQSSFHVMQIYYKGGEAEIDKAYKDLQSGVPFEKVAAKRFPGLPKGMKAPWDLGYLRWFQIPPPWQGTLETLAPGQSSGIIKGPGERFWLIKLVDKPTDPKITFATEKDRIVEVLKSQKADALYASMLDEFKKKSKITVSK